MFKSLFVFFSGLFLSVSLYAEDITNKASGVGDQAVANAGVNVGFGQKMLNICNKPNAVGVWACPIAKVSFEQAIKDFLTKKSSDSTRAAVTTGGGLGDFNSGQNGLNNPSLDIDNSIAEFVDIANKGNAELSKLGYKMDKDGSVTGPNGKKVTPSQMTSGKAMADAGFIDESDIGKYDEALKKEKKRRNKIIVKSLGGAKGGYKSRRARRSTASDSGAAYSFGLDKSKIRAAKTSGLAKDFGGTPIGVASDDLFNMLSTRYDSLKEERQFIDNADGTYSEQR